MAYITWNPSGTIIDLGFYELRWYSILFGLGFVLSYIILNRYFKKEGIKEEMLEKLTVYVVLSSVIGMRLGHCIFYDWDYYSQHLLEIFLPFRFEPEFQFTGFSGLASHGGAFGIVVGIILYSRKYKMGFFEVMDKLALVVPIAGFCIRMGNLMNSEIIGKSTDVPWAFIFVQVDNTPRHPGQLYEALSYLLIFFVMNFLYQKLKKEPGFIFGIFLILLFTARFVIEFFKIEQSEFEVGMALNMGQILSIPFVIAGILMMVWKRKDAPKKPVSENK